MLVPDTNLRRVEGGASVEWKSSGERECFALSLAALGAHDRRVRSVDSMRGRVASFGVDVANCQECSAIEIERCASGER